MFASVRCYTLQSALRGEIARLVEAELADRIAAQPGFVWYAFLDCGGGDVMTISVFRERDQPARSRELTQRWIVERARGFDLTRTEALDGPIPVSRAALELLQPTLGRFARVRRYRTRDGDLGEFVWRVVDTGLAERIASLDRFAAYFVFSPGTGELVTVSVFLDRAAAAASDELALAFARDNLDHLDIERTDTIGGGEIVVSRINEALLEPIRPFQP
jgi:hypothetical protein